MGRQKQRDTWDRFGDWLAERLGERPAVDVIVAFFEALAYLLPFWIIAAAVIVAVCYLINHGFLPAP